MGSNSPNLAQIKVQTARMVELYELLQRQLAQGNGIALSAEDRDRLHRSIAVIESNMRQLQAYFANRREESSPLDPEGRELEEILNAVLQWQLAHENSA